MSAGSLWSSWIFGRSMSSRSEASARRHTDRVIRCEAATALDESKSFAARGAMECGSVAGASIFLRVG